MPRSRDAEPLLVHLSTAEGLRFRSTLNFIFLQLAQLQASFTPSLTAAYEDVLHSPASGPLSPTAESGHARAIPAPDWCGRPAS